MDLSQIRETSVWELYMQSQNFARKMDIYNTTDTNFRMYGGDQWAGLKVEGIEPVQLNYIKAIIDYKLGVIGQNLWAINYNADYLLNEEFAKKARRACELLNKEVAKIWERTYMDYKVRQFSKNAAINTEAPIYINYDEGEKIPELEILNKPDIYFGNENNSDIQKQPYVLIKKRMPVSQAKIYAKEKGASEKEVEYIIGDQETFEEAGEAAKEEKDNMVTVVHKFWKEEGTVHIAIATRYCDIVKDDDTRLSLYPITHMIWGEEQGSARGYGEITPGIIANQTEVNRTVMRRAVVVKNTAYTQKIVNIDKIENPEALDEVGGIIRVKDVDAQSVSNMFANVAPAQMSSDVEKLQNDLIQITRELASASQAAAGDIDAEQASGRAILAVQQASQQPLIEQLSMVKKTIEDIARILLDMIKTYNSDGLTIEVEEVDDATGEKILKIEKIDGNVLQELKATVKVDITPKSPFDKFAQEKSIENLFTNGMFSPQMLGQLIFYLDCLDDDAVMPKKRIVERAKKELDKQQRIAEIQARGQQIIQQQQQFYNQDPDAQAIMMMKEKLKERVRQDYESRKNSGQVEQVAEELEAEAENIESEEVNL